MKEKLQVREKNIKEEESSNKNYYVIFQRKGCFILKNITTRESVLITFLN